MIGPIGANRARQLIMLCAFLLALAFVSGCPKESADEGEAQSFGRTVEPGGEESTAPPIEIAPERAPDTIPAETESKPMRIWSFQFADGGMMQSRYTADGENVNPPLNIDGVPENAKSLALIMDDPDAPRGTWVHWVVFNISPATKEIAENSVPEGATVGKNSWGRNDYGGPDPPSGIHRYVFKLYALDTMLSLESSASKQDVEKAMEGHILADAQFVGRYTREK